MSETLVLKILFYVDDIAFHPGDEHRYTMKHLDASLSNWLVPTKVVVERRVGGVSLATLLEGCHEVWFFLRSTAEGSKALSEEEIIALKAWMDGGNGVLITGDHSSGDPLQGLGATVGKCVPRARHMRFWDDPPDLYTRVADSREVSDSVDPEKDDLPQRLLLPQNGMARPYSLFHGADGRILDRFPDHAHEGQVKDTIARPEPADKRFPEIANEWPFSPPRIRVIARAVDWRHGRTHDLMAQWDGPRESPAGQNYGRVLADSSFHHYVDANLDALEQSKDWATIQEIHRNQAAWLAPKGFRQQFRDQALRRIRRDPEVQVMLSSDEGKIGEAAMPLIARLLPGVWIYDLIEDIYDENHVPPGKRVRGKDVDAWVLGAHIKFTLMPEEDVPLAMMAKMERGAGHGLRAAIEGYARRQEEQLEKLSLLQTALRLGPDNEEAT